MAQAVVVPRLCGEVHGRLLRRIHGLSNTFDALLEVGGIHLAANTVSPTPRCGRRRRARTKEGVEHRVTHEREHPNEPISQG